MEIVKNRYGAERVYEKISPNKIRVMGETEFSRGAQNNDGEPIMFDFEGGPCLNVGGFLNYGKMKWEIISLSQEKINRDKIASIVCEVKMK